MKTLIIAFSVIFINISGISQENNPYNNLTNKILKKEKRMLVNETLQLTAEEAEVFWTLYQEYNEQLIQLEIEHLQLVERYRSNLNSLNDEIADQFWTNKLRNLSQYDAVTNEYYLRFKEVLPAHRVAQYFQLEYKIRLLVHAALTEEIPLIAIK